MNNKDDDLKALQNQLGKARAVWGRIGKILKKRADSNIRIMSIFYKVILETELLYGAESWVLNDHGRNKLKTAHHRSAWFMTGRYITKINEEWVYPDTKRTLELAHLLPIEEYITNRKNTIQLYALDTDIYNDCIIKSLHTKADNSLQWWTEYKQQNKEICETVYSNYYYQQNNEIYDIVYDTYDMNQIQLEWCTEIHENTISETEIITWIERKTIKNMKMEFGVAKIPVIGSE